MHATIVVCWVSRSMKRMNAKRKAKTFMHFGMMTIRFTQMNPERNIVTMSPMDLSGKNRKEAEAEAEAEEAEVAEVVGEGLVESLVEKGQVPDMILRASTPRIVFFIKRELAEMVICVVSNMVMRRVPII